MRKVLALLCFATLFAGCQSAPRPVSATAAVKANAAAKETAQVHLRAYEGAALLREEPAGTAEIINGALGKKIEPKNVVIAFDELVLLIPVEKDVSYTKNMSPPRVPVITNLPAGLIATVRSAPAGSSSVTVTVEGTPTELKKENLVISFSPGTVKNEGLTLSAKNVLIHIADAVSRSSAPLYIGGSAGTPITPRDITVDLKNTALKDDLTTADRYLSGLPAGLNAVFKPAPKGSTSLSWTISGVSTAPYTASETLAVVIPAAAVDAGVSLEVGIPVTFDLGSVSAAAYDRRAFGTVNPNWRGNHPLQANYPDIPSIKNFDAVGIIQLSAEMVERLGESGEYEWTGDNITYGKLMAAAARLGAHAIINTTIESDDKIRTTRTVRPMEDDHVLRADELGKIQNGTLRVTSVAGKRYLEETVRVTTRTITGTALAIKYTDSLNFYEAEGLKMPADRATVEMNAKEKRLAAEQKAVLEAEKAAEAARSKADADRAAERNAALSTVPGAGKAKK